MEEDATTSRIDPEAATSSMDQDVPAVLEKIAFCESGNRQFYPDGTLVRGKVNPKDVGRFQINETYHLKAAQALGLDLYTWAGNTAYALHLYRTQGTGPWSWSKSCWDGL